MQWLIRVVASRILDDHSPNKKHALSAVEKYDMGIVFRSKLRNDTSPERVFMNVTVILLVIGLMWLGLGIGYLTS